MNPTVRFAFICIAIFWGVVINGSAMSTNWPPTDYSEVRAYIYNLEGRHGGIVKNGALNKTIENKKGILLSQSQVAKVSQFLKGPLKPDPLQNIAECIMEPRHALVFFDSNRKPVAFIDVCFECWGFTTSAKLSDGIPDPIDLDGLRTFFIDLKLPVFQKPEDYVKFKKKYFADR
jgi:hypothetical protein